MTEAASPECCAYCGLPVEGSNRSRPGLPGSSRPVPAAPQTANTESNSPAAAYCCYGCRVAAVITNECGEEGQTRWQLTRLGLAIFFTMNVMVFTLALWSWDVYEDEALASHQANVLFELLRYASLFLASLVTLLLGGPLLENALENLRRGEITTDLLIVAGVVAALLYSLASVLSGGQHTYFEVACMVLVAVTLGRWLEAVGKLKTTNALRSLEKLLPDTVRVVSRVGLSPRSSQDRLQSCLSDEHLTRLDEVKVGDIIRVLPGERIGTDGIVRRGQAGVDQKIVTGESIAATKGPGEQVYAGTLNQDGDLLIEVTAPPRGGALLRIMEAVATAAATKCRLQTTADRVATWFVPGVVVVALATFTVHTSLAGVGSGLMSALAVLLIACPCALGIATPLAVWAAMGRASSAGVLFRHGDALQQLAAADAICFDKTGTLTTGETAVDDFAAEDTSRREEVLATALVLGGSSTHTLSAAIRDYALGQVDSSKIPHPTELKTRPGLGLVARLSPSEGPIWLGSLALMEEAGLQRSPPINAAITTILQHVKPLACVGWDGEVRGVFSFREKFRPQAPSSLAALQAAGFRVAVLTGDYAARAAPLEQTLGIPVTAELLPEQKLAVIRDLRRTHGPVVMVGDGINDAPALAEADVGIAMGCGADVSREAADVCLLGDNLDQVGWSIDLAKTTMRTVHQNLFWAFSYNVIGIGLAATGILNPIWASVAMVGSSLFVISNSLRLTRTKEPERAAEARAEESTLVAVTNSSSIAPESGFSQSGLASPIL